VKHRIKKHPDDDYYEKFEWEDVLVDYHKLRKWLLAGFISLPYKSSNHKMYQFIDIDATEKAIDEFKRIQKVEREPQDNKPIRVKDDLFTSIYGLDDIKEVIKMAMKADKQVHVALWGPPATAKSLFLLELSRLESSHYVVGSSSTKVGLSEILMDHKPRMLLIDEIDKLAKHPDDLSVLLSLMETRLVKNAKHGKHDSVKLNTKIFAAGNINNLPAELESRFISLTFQEYGEEDFKKVAVHYLVKAENVDRDLAEYIANEVYKFSKDVRKARHIARLCETKDEVDTMIKVLRKYSNGENAG
ncbi:MAG: hypothetical protein R6V01_00060, partial [Thermoplasmatota archaeon]